MSVKLLFAAILLAASMVGVSEGRGYGHGGSHSSGRTYYGGGHHTYSHGGSYRNGSGSSHRGGHYSNLTTGNRYRRHR